MAKKKISDTAFEKVPAFAERIAVFIGKLKIAHMAPGSITDYCHALYKAVAYAGQAI